MSDAASPAATPAIGHEALAGFTRGKPLERYSGLRNRIAPFVFAAAGLVEPREDGTGAPARWSDGHYDAEQAAAFGNVASFAARRSWPALRAWSTMPPRH